MNYASKQSISFISSMVPHKQPKILVVEDSPLQILVIQNFLKAYDCTVDIAQNGKEALELISLPTTAAAYDLIFMDYNLPDMLGTEICKQIRRVEKTHIPIIALTAQTDLKIKKACFAVGMDEFTNKPLQLAKLDSILQRWG